MTAAIARTPRTDIANIPGEMRQLPQWVNARGKIPVDPKTGEAASSTDPTTWGSFEQALARAETAGLGIGFVLTREAGIVAVDIDGCIDETGALSEDAAAIVARMATYTERSTSGRGLHLYMWSDPTPGTRTKNVARKVEIWDSARYVIVTGDHMPGSPALLEERTVAVADLYRDLFPPEQAPAATPRPIAALSADDAEILRRCELVPDFAALWAGDISGQANDHSSADFRLCGILAWAGADQAQADSLFRGSGLYRAKWERTDYRTRTITNAFAGCTRFWEPPRTSMPAAAERPAIAGDGDDLPEDVPSLKETIRRLTRELDEERAARRKAEDRADMLSDLQSRNAGILRNKNLGAERQTAVAVANILANRAEAEPTPDGMHPVYMVAIAESAGASTDTVARHLDRLVGMETGLRKETRMTMTPRGPEKRVFIGLEPGTNVVDFAAAVAVARPETPRNGWGGRRVTCSACGADTPVLKRTEMVCTGCGEVLETREEILKPQDAASAPEAEETAVAGPMPQDAASATRAGETDVEGPMPQDAASGFGPDHSHRGGVNVRRYRNESVQPHQTWSDGAQAAREALVRRREAEGPQDAPAAVPLLPTGTEIPTGTHGTDRHTA